MDEFSDFNWMFEVQSVSSIIQHHDVVTRKLRKAILVKRHIIEDLTLERLRPVEHQAASMESLFKLGESVYVLLVRIDCLKIDLKRSIWIQVEKKRRLNYWILDFRFDLFYRVYQRHIL